MVISLAIPAFIAGLLTFLAPCTLPLVPGYLVFISGASLSDLQDSTKTKQARRKIFYNGLLFILGFSLVFILLGVLAGALGRLLLPYRLWLARLGGILVIIFGLYLLGALEIPFFLRGRSWRLTSLFERSKAFNSLLLGVTFGFGWSPCIGPVLATILLLAATTATIWQGGVLLVIFSLGLALPFLLIALAIGTATKLVHKFSHYLKYLSLIAGIFLLILGILMLTNNYNLWVGLFYRWFDFLNYRVLLNYL